MLPAAITVLILIAALVVVLVPLRGRVRDLERALATQAQTTDKALDAVGHDIRDLDRRLTGIERAVPPRPTTNQSPR